MVSVRHPAGATSEPVADWLGAVDAVCVAVALRLAVTLRGADADADADGGVGELDVDELDAELGEASAATACTGADDCALATNTPAVTARTMRSNAIAQRPGPCRHGDLRPGLCLLRSMLRRP